MAHIAILIHQHDRFEDQPYFLTGIAEVWRGQGHRVSVVRGPGPSETADIAVLHVTPTVTSPDYIEALSRYPRVINGSVIDISKRVISRQLVHRADDYDGPVIVKTDLNCGGLLESRLWRGSSRWRRRLQKLRHRLPWSLRSVLTTNEYRVFDAVDDVPRAVWWNRHLVVERFRSERRDGYYCLRTWIFFGKQESNVLAHATDPIVKLASIVHREPVADVPIALRAIREELGFDYGKFDYAIVEGEAVLYDANRTPALSADRMSEFGPRFELLAAGLDDLLP